ncbi:LysR family transcriptional regulator [Sulfitobacter mediterraneus]|uniref:LysR family transcriptional regulator n=1 Tax=Sulfitobacter mediterraneus TaxID=83219 RepID=UPI00193A2FBA|nr:LysR family transcriptional regulator [Sulfitobacter mediterraneus]MBM1556144.1 LysR family transcriptional regulator [Sulfitobacter mediterraneus]MBM1567818.1 LysR family transcriptional regulator [Sulfitobacter mediterraneus]MBM1571498.1 LysR family transcriptional regulator [Sulfitobacter mediterraneus]MBM1575286.1 LysR family transcriptional regulator [Sulfitobacter mediterraneus]MBM1579223.1 LysR family transcriptional regulator [Sulfitobacter mediterraneus]
MLYLTLRHYSYVAAIADHGSLSAAAAHLNVSQPSLSNALDIIEARLQRPLFLRGRGQGVTITPDGRSFVKEAKSLIASARRLEQSGRSPLSQTSAALGCFHDLAPFVLAPALSRLRQSLPEMELHSRLGSFETLVRDMTEGTIDLAITWDIGLDARFSKRVLGHLRPHAFVAMDHPLACRAALTLSDLAHEQLILSDDGLSVQHMVKLCQSAGFTPHLAGHAAPVEVMRSLAAHGEGIGISYSVPPSRQSYDGRDLRAIPLTDPAAEEPVVLAQLGDPAPGGTLHLIAETLEKADLFRLGGA